MSNLTASQLERGRSFEALHQRDRAFVIPNPWDIGSAHLLAGMGFEALATTSAGYSFSKGQRDNTIGRDEMTTHAAEIVGATDLPVNFLMFKNDPALGIARLSEIGVKRISTGSSLARAAFGAFIRAAKSVRDDEEFAWLDETVRHPEISQLF